MADDFQRDNSENQSAVENREASASNAFRAEFLAALEPAQSDPGQNADRVRVDQSGPSFSGKDSVLPSLTIISDEVPAYRSGEQTERQQLTAEDNHQTLFKPNPMENQDIGWWGDDHDSVDTKDQFIQEIPNLKAQGVTTIAMELFTREQQPLIDRFLASQDPSESATIREQLLKQLNEMWDPSGGDQARNALLNERIMRILDAAKANGLKVLALEPNGLNMRTGANSDKRDSNWERTLLTDRRQNPNARYVVFQGGNHLNYNLQFFRNVTLRTPQASTPFSH